MKELIFFLALSMSVFTLLNVIANITTNIVKAMVNKTYNTSLISEMIQGVIACGLWTWFYHL